MIYGHIALKQSLSFADVTSGSVPKPFEIGKLVIKGQKALRKTPFLLLSSGKSVIDIDVLWSLFTHVNTDTSLLKHKREIRGNLPLNLSP